MEVSLDLTYQKLLKSVSFWQSYSNNKNGGRFMEHSVVVSDITRTLLVC